MKVIKIPKNLRIFKKVDYPPHNIGLNLEGEITKRLLDKSKSIKTNLNYLPIQWTNYFIKNKYGKNISELEKFYLKKLNKKSKKYFTVIQYADGHLLETKNILFFSASGLDKKLINQNTSYIKIPLISEGHVVSQNNSGQNKKYLASFIGRNTHQVRVEMTNNLEKNKNFYLNLYSTPDISKDNQLLFKKLMNESFFSLCPRGYGVTSYRLFESFAFNVIPIYISEEKDFYLPFDDIIDWDKLCILQDINTINELPSKLNNLVETGIYKDMLQYGKYCNQKYFNYDFITEYIINKIKLF